MSCNFEVKIFRFNVKMDYESYYSTHEICLDENDNVLDLLNAFKQKEYFFGYNNNADISIKINSITTKQNEILKKIQDKFGNELTIEPLMIKRSYHDLLINTDDFKNKFDFLASFANFEDKKFYDELEFLYYSSATLKFKEDYIGDGILITAYEMIQKYPSFKNEILKKLANSNIWYHTKIQQNLFSNSDEFDTKINYLKFEILKNFPKINHITNNLNKQLKDYL